MTEVLSKNEIDMLLSAISSGDSDTDEVRQRGQRKIKIYDFRRPDKFSQEHIRTMSIMHDTFARLASTSISAQLSSLVDLRVLSVDQLTYEEFIKQLSNPTTIAVITMEPLKGSAILEIDTDVTFTVIDRLLGGAGETIRKTRSLTEIEHSVIEGVIVRILGHMRDAWAQVVDLRPRLAQIETNPQFAQIVPPEAMILLVALGTKINEVEGQINFCLPYITIEPIISKLSARYWYSTTRRSNTIENLTMLRQLLGTVKLPLSVEIGTIDISVRDVLSLRIGDIVRLNHTKSTDPFRLFIGSRAKYHCLPGKYGRSAAVRITSSIEDVMNNDEVVEELSAEGDI